MNWWLVSLPGNINNRNFVRNCDFHSSFSFAKRVNYSKDITFDLKTSDEVEVKD